MIVLTSCPNKKYFDVQELWFRYKERIEFEEKGLFEGTRVFVADKTEDNVIIKTEVMTINLTYEEASDVYGDVYIKSNKKVKQKNR